MVSLGEQFAFFCWASSKAPTKIISHYYSWKCVGCRFDWNSLQLRYP